MRRYLTEFRERLPDVFAAYGICILWVVFFLCFANVMYALVLGGKGVLQAGLLSVSFRFLPNVALSTIAAHPLLAIFSVLVAAPLLEEAVFRLLPLPLGRALDRGNGLLVQAMLYGVCFVIFGWLHGSYANVAIQGVVGLVLGRLFLRGGERNLFVPSTPCAFVLSAYNSTFSFAVFLH